MLDVVDFVVAVVENLAVSVGRVVGAAVVVVAAAAAAAAVTEIVVTRNYLGFGVGADSGTAVEIG